MCKLTTTPQACPAVSPIPINELPIVQELTLMPQVPDPCSDIVHNRGHIRFRLVEVLTPICPKREPVVSALISRNRVSSIRISCLPRLSTSLGGNNINVHVFITPTSRGYRFVLVIRRLDLEPLEQPAERRHGVCYRLGFRDIAESAEECLETKMGKTVRRVPRMLSSARQLSLRGGPYLPKRAQLPRVGARLQVTLACTWV